MARVGIEAKTGGIRVDDWLAVPEYDAVHPGRASILRYGILTPPRLQPVAIMYQNEDNCVAAIPGILFAYNDD